MSGDNKSGHYQPVNDVPEQNSHIYKKLLQKRQEYFGKNNLDNADSKSAIAAKSFTESDYSRAALDPTNINYVHRFPKSRDRFAGKTVRYAQKCKRNLVFMTTNTPDIFEEHLPAKFLTTHKNKSVYYKILNKCGNSDKLRYSAVPMSFPNNPDWCLVSAWHKGRNRYRTNTYWHLMDFADLTDTSGNPSKPDSCGKHKDESKNLPSCSLISYTIHHYQEENQCKKKGMPKIRRDSRHLADLVGATYGNTHAQIAKSGNNKNRTKNPNKLKQDARNAVKKMRYVDNNTNDYAELEDSML